MLVTDIKRKLKGCKLKTGFYMDGYLKRNLDGIPDFLKKEWDVVGMFRSWKVGTGKKHDGIKCCILFSMASCWR